MGERTTTRRLPVVGQCGVCLAWVPLTLLGRLHTHRPGGDHAHWWQPDTCRGRVPRIQPGA